MHDDEGAAAVRDDGHGVGVGDGRLSHVKLRDHLQVQDPAGLEQRGVQRRHLPRPHQDGAADVVLSCVDWVVKIECEVPMNMESTKPD